MRPRAAGRTHPSPVTTTARSSGVAARAIVRRPRGTLLIVSGRSHLVSVMSAVEALVETGHRPARTIIMAFGFDEESAGTQGAGKLAASLEQQFGRDSMELIVHCVLGTTTERAD